MTEHPVRGRQKKASINDVAQHAGVSAQTVSRVVNHSSKVRNKTREKVLESMDALGYVPNLAARALRVGGYSTIGVIMHRLARAGEALTIESIVRNAEKYDYATALVQVSEPGPEGLKRAATRLSQQSVEGVIIVRGGEAAGVDLRIPPHFPVAVADPAFIGDYPLVMGDEVDGTRKAIDHLLSLGHKNIYHVGGASDSTPARNRLKAWKERLAEEGIQPLPHWPGDWTAQSGYEAGKFVAQNPDITAVFCANDEMAFGLLRALREEGVSVPNQVSVVGFDSITLSEFSSPPLTTIAIDYDALGTELFDLLRRQINDRGNVDRSEQILVPTDLVIRETTAKAPL